MGGRGWEAAVVGQRYGRGTVTWVAVPPWLSSANLALSIFAKLRQGPRSSTRSITAQRSVNITIFPGHSNRKAVSSSAAPIVSSQPTAPNSGAELCIYSHACTRPIAPSTTARLKSLPAVAMTPYRNPVLDVGTYWIRNVTFLTDSRGNSNTDVTFL